MKNPGQRMEVVPDFAVSDKGELEAWE